MRIGLAVAILMAAGWIPLYLFRVEDPTETFGLYSGFERLWVVVAPLVIGTHVGATYAQISVSTELSLWRVLAALTVFGGGLVLWIWGRAQIGPLRARRFPEEPPARLRDDGPFGLVRHPLYLGILICALAPLILTGGVVFMLSYALCVTSLVMRARQEERRMHALMGQEYAVYCSHVKRLIPFVW